MNDNLTLLKLLADKTRLDILNLLLKEDSYVEKIAYELTLTPATICYHLKKLENAGVVRCSRSQFYIIYSVNQEIFAKPLSAFVKNENVRANDETYRKQILSNFFRYGKLVKIPSQRKKREIVLAKILESFESGKIYTENEVNEIIHRFHEDHCTIRREMVSFGMLDREHLSYWVRETV